MNFKLHFIPDEKYYKEAYKFIELFSKFNGLNYFEYTDLNLPDFEIMIDSDNEKESYKVK